MPETKAKITFVAGPEAGRELPIDADPFYVGRGEECSHVLEVEGASRHHFCIYRDGDAWHVRDMESTNGTKLNGQRTDDSPLTTGDEITVGDAVMRFEEIPVDGETAAADAPAKTASPETTAPKPPPAAPPSRSTSEAPEGTDEEVQEMVRQMSLRTRQIKEELSKAIIGQTEIVMELLTALISGGHVLMIGLPGLAKTTMISNLSKVLALDFRRIQFTPDLMPSDITGTDVLEVDEQTGHKEYRFIKGPIFSNILLADEINRTPPKTQAALLEAMQEHRVTAAGETYDLKPPFFVLATQNPLEQEGTYPLPEAQLDRFMFSIYVDYPTEEEEELIAKTTTRKSRVELNRVLDAQQIIELQEVVRELPISDHVVRYATRLARATRPGDARAPDFIKKWVHCGAGPRASQYLIVGAKARAITEGRLLVSTDDVRASARPILRHRMFTNFTADSEGVDTDAIVKKLIEAVPEPDEKDYR